MLFFWAYSKLVYWCHYVLSIAFQTSISLLWQCIDRHWCVCYEFTKDGNFVRLSFYSWESNFSFYHVFSLYDASRLTLTFVCVLISFQIWANIVKNHFFIFFLIKKAYLSLIYFLSIPCLMKILKCVNLAVCICSWSM